MTQAELTIYNRRRVFEYIRANPNKTVDEITDGIGDYNRNGVFNCLRWHISPENQHVKKYEDWIKKSNQTYRVVRYRAIVDDCDDGTNKVFEVKHTVSKSEFQSLPSFLKAIVTLEGV